MIKNLLCTAILLIGVNLSFSSNLTDDPRVFPVLIESDFGFGSGCLLKISNSVYLATAKHVLLHTEGTNQMLPLKITVTSYTKGESNAVSKVKFEADLKVLSDNAEVRWSPDHDGALIRLEEKMEGTNNFATQLPGLHFLQTSMQISVNDATGILRCQDVDPGADAYLFGYPTSLTSRMAMDLDPADPLIRKGIVAGFGREHRLIIVDCPSYQGNSGGPVIQISHPQFGVDAMKIIGLVHGFIPFEEVWENRTLQYSHTIASNSGYTIIEPMDAVLDLVWK